MPFDGSRWELSIVAADKTAQAFRTVDQRMKALDTQTKATSTAMNAGFALAARALAPLAAAFSAAAVAQKIWAAGMKAADLGEQAEQIGLTTDQLQAYRLAAAQAGIEAEQMDAAMMRLARSMGSANDGNDEAIARFEKLGVKVLDANGNLRKAADVMPEVARGLLGISSETERSATMQELFGRSGARLITVLEQLAEGNDEVVASAKAQGAIIGSEVIKAWDELDGKLKASAQKMDTFLATIGKPVAVVGLQMINFEIEKMTMGLRLAQHSWEWLKGRVGSGVSAQDAQAEANQVQARIDQLHKQEQTTTRDALLQREYARLGVLQQQVSDQMTAAYMPEITVAAAREGARNPISNSARKAGERDAAAALRESQRQMDELFALMEKQRKAADAIEDRFGDGAETLARETAELAEIQHLLAPETVQRAMKDLTDKADDQARAVRGAAGGFDGYLAGIEQAVAEMERANSAFEYGKQTVDLMADALTELATTGEINFQKLLGSFINMIIQMEMRAAASNVWGALGGAGGLLGLLGIGGVSSSAPLSFGGGGAGIDLAGGLAGGWMPGFASGGTPPVGRPYVVGEDGPEIRVDGSPGTIFNREQIAGMGGGGTTINIRQTVIAGEFATKRDLAIVADQTKRAAIDGAQAALINRKKRGGLDDVFG
jgi:lambda family phage tail tape measure protein